MYSDLNLMMHIDTWIMSVQEKGINNRLDVRGIYEEILLAYELCGANKFREMEIISFKHVLTDDSH